MAVVITRPLHCLRREFLRGCAAGDGIAARSKRFCSYRGSGPNRVAFQVSVPAKLAAVHVSRLNLHRPRDVRKLRMSRRSLGWLVFGVLAIAGIAAAGAWLDRESTLVSAARVAVERSQGTL